jgi:hypothetical protein
MVIDINDDGNKDIVIVGNHYGVEVETTRYDAGIGGILLGDGKNNFRYLEPTKSGFNVPYDSRDLKTFKSAGKNHILVANNNESVSVYSTKK